MTRLDTRLQVWRNVASGLVLALSLAVAGCGVVDTRSGLVPSHSDEDIGLLVQVDLTTLDPLEFAALDLLCSSDPSTPVSLPCNEYIHAECTGAGYATGFGARTGSLLSYVCTKNTVAELRNVGFSTALSECDVDPLCAGDPACEAEVALDCLVAIDQYCVGQSAEYASGFGPVARDATSVDVACTRAKAVDLETVAITTLDPGGSCDPLSSGGDVSQTCSAKISSYCAVSNAVPGGFGPTGYANPSDEVPVACVRVGERYERNAESPRSPAIEADVVPIDLLRDGNGDLILDGGGLPQYREAHTRRSHFEPGRNTSNDGRLYPGVEVPVVGEGATGIWLGLYLPELLQSPLGADVPDGAVGIRAHTDHADLYFVDLDAIFGTPGQVPTKIVHLTLCDPGSSLGSPNPRPCDVNSTTTRTAADLYDCYDVTMVNIFEDDDQVWGTDLTVRVEDPKTSQAKVVAVGYGTPQLSPLTDSLFEPTVSGDGRLLLVHGLQGTGLGISYSYIAPPGSPVEQDPDWPWQTGDACDVTRWATLEPISSMHADPYLDDYPVARYPIRDMENNVFEAGQVVWGAYPWIDRAGRNIAMAHGGSTLGYTLVQGGATVYSRYPIAGGTDPAAGFDPTRRIGRVFMGLWTHGKMVAFDGRLNAADFGIDGPEFHHDLNLYIDDADQPVSVEVGATIAHFIGSTEHTLNHLPNLRSVLPRDVVWNVSAGTVPVSATEEVAFDDFLFPAALVVSTMNVTVDNLTRGLNDGFEFTSPPSHGELNIGNGFKIPPRIANAATAIPRSVTELSRFAGEESVVWEVPAYGKLLGGARAEPVAAGGIRGRGLWLDGVDDRLEYFVDRPHSSYGRRLFNRGAWLYSVSVDGRGLANDTEERLISWPDGSWLNIAVNGLGEQSLHFGRGSVDVSVSIPAGLELVPREWGHLAVVSEQDGQGGSDVRLYWGGFLLYEELATSESLFRMNAGLLTLGWAPGAGPSGFHGWVDEFKAIAHEPGPEEVCNHANGTLVSVFDTSGREAALYQLASLYDDSSPPGPGWSQLDGLLGAAPGEKYACERVVPPPAMGEDYLCYGKLRTPGWNANAAACLRDRLNSSQIYVDAARADSTTNEFCLTCHVDTSVVTTLDVANSLAPGSVNMPDDPRRQPFQHPTHMFGRIPAAHFQAGPNAGAVGLPTADWPTQGISAGNPYESGEAIDQYTTPVSPP